MGGIFLAAALTFAPALRNDFCLDDGVQVLGLSVPGTLAGWARAVAEPWWKGNPHVYLWRPLTRLSILLQRALTGQTRWPFYGFNILLHAGVSLLLYRLGRWLGMVAAAAGLGALLFAVHPIHTEAVHQIVGRAELFTAFWVVSGLILLVRFGLNDWRSWLLQPLFFALALGSKESGVIYPALVFLTLYGMGKGEARRADRGEETRNPEYGIRDLRIWGLMAVFVLMTGLFLAARHAVTGGFLESHKEISPYDNPLAQMTFTHRLPAVLGIFGYVAAHLIWPGGLSPDYSAISFPYHLHWGWAWSWAGLAVLAASGVYCVYEAWRGRRGWLLAVAALAAYGLISNGPFTFGTAMAGRFWYLPSAPVCLGVGWLLARFYRRMGSAWLWGALGLAGLLISFSWIAVRAGRDWRSDENFTRATLARFPKSWRGHVKMAHLEYTAGRYRAGYEHARQAVQLFPGEYAGWFWRGACAAFLPECRDEVETDFKRTLTLNPKDSMAHRYFADYLASQHRNAEAIGHLREYLKDPVEDDRETVEKLVEILNTGLSWAPLKP